MGCCQSEKSEPKEQLIDTIIKQLRFTQPFKDMGEKYTKEVILFIYTSVTQYILSDFLQTLETSTQDLSKEKEINNLKQKVQAIKNGFKVYIQKRKSQTLKNKITTISTQINSNSAPKGFVEDKHTKGVFKDISNRQSAKQIQQRLIRQISRSSKLSRSSAWRESERSELTNIQSPINKTYSLPMQVLELKEREKMMIQLQEVINQNKQSQQTYQQMVKISHLKIMQQDNENKQLQSAITKLQMQNTKIKEQLQESKRSIQIMVKNSQSLRTTIESLSSVASFHKTKIQELSTQNQRLNRHNQQLSNNNRILQQQNGNLLLIIEIQNQQFAKQKMNAVLKKTSQSDLKGNDYHTILKYFGHSNLLPNYEEPTDAATLRHQVLRMFSKNVSATKLIYRYQPLSQLHFNQYIKNKNNLFVLIELQNQIYVGGFAGEVDQNQDVQDTFLFSLSLKREPICLVSREKIKRIDYESGFINFGNGQIKLKAKSTSFTCNVSGLFTVYFNGQKRTSIQKFLGDQQRSREVKGYQIYEIFFQNNIQ